MPDEIFQLYEQAARSILAGYTGQDGGDLDYDDAVDALGLPDICKDDAALGAAAVILSGVQRRLPQWGSFDGNQTHLSRSFNQTDDGQIKLAPTLICSVNWATTGPGYSWPITYFLTYLPGYDVEVLTASADIPELFGGMCDLAVAWKKPKRNRRHLAIGLLSDFWDNQISTYQCEWEEVTASGLVDRLTGFEILTQRREDGEECANPSPAAVGDEVLKVFSRDELQCLSKTSIASIAAIVRHRLCRSPQSLNREEQDALRRLILRDEVSPAEATVLNFGRGER